MVNLFSAFNGQVIWSVSGECFDRQIFDWNNLKSERLQDLVSNYSLAIINFNYFESIISRYFAWFERHPCVTDRPRKKGVLGAACSMIPGSLCCRLNQGENNNEIG